MPPAAPVRASDVIPSVFRFLLLYIEPFFAFNGAVLVLYNPSLYASNMTRETLTQVAPIHQFAYTQLAGAWLFFAFTEAVVLRLVDHVSVWRLLCIGMLLSDVAYVHSCAQGVGGWVAWSRVGEWSAAEWVVTMTTWPFVLTRVAVALGIGQREPPVDQAKKVM